MSFTFWGVSVDEFNVFHLFWVSFQEWNRTVPMWDFPVPLKNKSPCITNHLITWLLLCADGCSVKLGCGGGTFLYCHSLVTKIKTHQAIECALLSSKLRGGMVLPRAVRVSASYPCHYSVVFAQRRSFTQNHKTQGRASRRTPNLLPTLSLSDTSCKLFHTCSFQTTHLQLSSPGVL